METLRKTLLLLCTLAFSLGVLAQTVSGKLVDEQNQPLPYANVVLLSLSDSAFVAGTISDADGTFTLEATTPNQLVRISSIGYSTVYRPVNPADLGVIQLKSDAQLLGEVVVNADLPVTRIKGNAMVTTVKGSVLEKSGTTEQLLDKIPNVSSKDGEINVFGRGVPDVYINGRKVVDKAELDRLSAENVKSVEVINNPGARYGAEVTSVIRIVTNRAEGEGFGFDNRTLLEYNRDWSALEQLNFNYRKGSFDLSGTVYGSRSYGWAAKDFYQDTYLQQHWSQESDVFTDGTDKEVGGQLALNYTFDENNAIGIRYGYDRTPENNMNMILHTQVFRDNSLIENTVSPNLETDKEDTHQLNVYYIGQWNRWNIDLNLDGYWSDIHKENSMDEVTRLPDQSEENQVVSTFNDVDNALYAARLILSRPVGGGELALGGEYTYTNRNNVFVNPEGIINDDDSRIRENMGAFFAEYGRSFGKVQMQAGLRYEYTSSDYYEEGRRIEEQSKTYNDLFPTFSLSFPIRRVNIQLAYRTDIVRPSYWNLRSNVLYANKYTYETGNPLLKPTLTQNVTLGATYRWMQLTAGYNRIKNQVINVTSLYDEENPTIMLMSLANAPAYDKVFAGLTLSPTIGLWHPQWRFQVTRQGYNAQTPQGPLKLHRPMGTFVWNNNFQLPWGILLDADFSYRTKGDMQNGRFLEPSWRADLSLQKSFLDDNLNIRFDALNVLDSYKRDFIMYVSDMQTMRMDEKSTHCSFKLTARYKFNATKSKYKGTGAGESQKSRM